MAANAIGARFRSLLSVAQGERPFHNRCSGLARNLERMRPRGQTAGRVGHELRQTPKARPIAGSCGSIEFFLRRWMSGLIHPPSSHGQWNLRAKMHHHAPSMIHVCSTHASFIVEAGNWSGSSNRLAGMLAAVSRRILALANPCCHSTAGHLPLILRTTWTPHHLLVVRQQVRLNHSLICHGLMAVEPGPAAATRPAQPWGR
jgi:hypothetical protein